MTKIPGLNPEEEYRDEDSFLLPDTDRVELPGDDESIFQEEQAFDQVWLWVLLGLETVAVLLALILASQPLMVIMVSSIAIVLTMSLMASLKLKTRIDNAGIHYRMVPFHWKEKTIPWEEIDSAYVRKYSAIFEYGGWGMRYGRNGQAFNVRGNDGIQIVRKDGKKILIGTQSQEVATRYLNKRPLTV